MDLYSGQPVGVVSVAVGSGGVVCTLMGMPYEALIFGLLGGLLLLANSITTSRTQAMSNIITGILIAGVGAPIVTEVILSLNSVMEKVGHDNILRASAMFIGAGWHAGVPMLMDVARSWLLKGRS